MAGAVMNAGVVAVVAGLVVSLGVVAGASVAVQRLSGTADAAALAAADTASGAVDGMPCEAAARIALAGAASLRECDVEGLIATITLSGAYGGISFDARSRAGPPEAPSP